MSNALLSDVEARAERRRTRTRDDLAQDLAQQAWRRAQVADQAADAAADSAADPAEARRWLGRAHRLAPEDGMVALALAAALLRDGAPDQAADLFRRQAGRHGAVEAWSGLAACAHLLGRPAEARAALAAALRSSVPTPTLRGLAAALAPAEGWCGLTTEGVLHAGPSRPTEVRLDGALLRLAWSRGTARLPPGWRAAGVLDVDGPAGPALGSPLPVRAFAGVEGFVEADGGGIRGWAWRPADPRRPPELRLEGPLGQRRLRPAAWADDVRHGRALARPRRIDLSATAVAALGAPVSVLGPDGRHLLGSPLDPDLESRAAGDPAHAGFAPVWADVIGPRPVPGAARPPADVVIPVYRGLAETLACLESVLASVPRGTRVIVVDDASPDRALADALRRLAARRRITLLRLPDNRGFPGAANAGLRAAAGRDAVLLNSDTLVPPGWLGRLRAAAYSADDVGTATPLTNDGTVVSYPDPAGGNPVPDLAAVIAADALAQRANGAATADLPVGVGFCLYLRRDCLDQVGLLREDVFAQGYGEENDLCLRARHRGWRSVAALGVFVGHAGATSFGAGREHLMRRNAAILARLHPGYDALVARHQADDPLHPAWQRMDALRWAAARRPGGAVILATHGGGGGVERVVARRAAAAAADGQRPVVLRPHRTPAGAPAVRVEQPGGPAFPGLTFAMPGALPALARLLRPDRPARLELHHLLGHHHALPDLATHLGIPLVSVVHDYARFCPRIALVSTGRRYCGEPDVAGCEACVADLGSLLEDDPSVPELLARSAGELGRAAQVIAPSRDAAVRIARHFPGVRPTVEPWDDDAGLPPPSPPPPEAVCRVAVVGAVGVEKGLDVLLGCARDARARRLPIEFVVVGFTADDERLMAAGPAFVTGEYDEAEAVALIRAQRAHLAFIPSVWPETWCLALTEAWRAGLPAAVFDLGAQAERVRRTGRGWLLPLGLAPPVVNDVLLRLARDRPPSQCRPQFA